MINLKSLLPPLAVVVVFLVLVFGWPTLYRYDHAQQGILVRTNRVTGKTSFYSPGWAWSAPKGEQQPEPEPPPAVDPGVAEAPSEPTPGMLPGETFSEYVIRTSKTPGPTPEVRSRRFEELLRAQTPAAH